MKNFKCQNCGQVLYFENTLCEACGHRLGYIVETATLSALEPEGEEWRALASPDRRFRSCANAGYDVCNWLVPAEAPDKFCAACRHNGTIPDLSIIENRLRWAKLETAKHRLFYTLLKLHLKIANRNDDPEHGLLFDFLADAPTPDGPKVMTGHDNGLITLNLKEADDAEREKLRTHMGEPYRTLLGHFRHEIGHYFWDVLVRDGGKLEACRALFGDDSEDYGQALQRHYAEGPPPNWQEKYISAYATTHPWEDFAETWAHYLHIVDTLETASAFGLSVHPKVSSEPSLHADIDFDPYTVKGVQDLIEAWLPLTFAINSLNRSMGLSDLYPFILSPTVITKMGFIHDLVHEAARE